MSKRALVGTGIEILGTSTVVDSPLPQPATKYSSLTRGMVRLPPFLKTVC